VTPLLPATLIGPVYLVSHGGRAFPDIVVLLQGDGVRVDLAGHINIDSKGITSSTFAALPDAPIGSFELTLPEGPHSALSAVGNLCRQALSMPTTITGQNGAQLVQKTRIRVGGCTGGGVKHKSRRARSRSGVVRRSYGRSGR
jgi:hypothetical protein